MKIRKVEALYSLKTSKGLIPRGIYSVDAPGGIPEVVLNEAILGRKTVRILEREPSKKTVEYIAKKQEQTVVTTLDEPKKEENTLDEEVKEVKEVKEEPVVTTLDEPKTKKTKKITKTKKSEPVSDEPKPKKKVVRKRKPAAKKKE